MWDAADALDLRSGDPVCAGRSCLAKWVVDTNRVLPFRYRTRHVTKASASGTEEDTNDSNSGPRCLSHSCGCQCLQMPGAEINNCIPYTLWGVITYPCQIYLLLAPKSSYVHWVHFGTDLRAKGALTHWRIMTQICVSWKGSRLVQPIITVCGGQFPVWYQAIT